MRKTPCYPLLYDYKHFIKCMSANGADGFKPFVDRHC